jgi:VCBS repeat-containing protein
VAGTYGSVQLDTSTGALTYTPDNSNPATNALSVGASVSDDYTITTDGTDGESALTVVSFAITGTNDLPTISATTPTATMVEVGVGPGNNPVTGVDTSNATLTIADTFERRLLAADRRPDWLAGRQGQRHGLQTCVVTAPAAHNGQ